MAIIAEHFYSPLHCLLTAKLSPQIRYLSSLKLSLFSRSIAPAAAAENPHIQQQHNPFAQLLRSECALSECEVSKIFRAKASFLTSGSKSVQTAQEAIQFFRDTGFTQDQVGKIIVRHPSVLNLKADRQLKPKIERMKALGLTGNELAFVVCRACRLLTSSLETLSSRIEYLETLYESKVDLIKTLKWGSWLLLHDVERQLKPNVELLQQSGVQGELFIFLISRCPGILTGRPDSLKFKIEYVREMGILQPSKSFANALMVLFKNGPETLRRKLKHLASLGLLEHEIKELIRRYPSVLNVSLEKMQKNMEFFIHIAGFPPNTVVSYPTIFGYSLETRIKPRYRVLKFITALQPTKRFPCLLSQLQMSEQNFLEKYVKCSPDATMLLEVYSGKPVDLDNIQSPSLQV